MDCEDGQRAGSGLSQPTQIPSATGAWQGVDITSGYQTGHRLWLVTDSRRIAGPLGLEQSAARVQPMIRVHAAKRCLTEFDAGHSIRAFFDLPIGFSTFRSRRSIRGKRSASSYIGVGSTWACRRPVRAEFHSEQRINIAANLRGGVSGPVSLLVVLPNRTRPVEAC